MARTNVKGNPFGGLGLERKEEKELKAYIKKEDTNLKRLLRELIREHVLK